VSQTVRARFAPPSVQQTSPGLPLLLSVLAGATVFANFGGEGLLGFNASGLAWAVSLAWAFVVVLSNPSRVAFPVWTWVPWRWSRLS